jgi:hypothetical protein
LIKKNLSTESALIFAPSHMCSKIHTQYQKSLRKKGAWHANMQCFIKLAGIAARYPLNLWITFQRLPRVVDGGGSLIEKS